MRWFGLCTVLVVLGGCAQKPVGCLERIAALNLLGHAPCHFYMGGLE